MSWVGLLAVVVGEALRLAAVLTARENFTHMVRFTRAPTHQLVTTGVYGWLRHPGARPSAPAAGTAAPQTPFPPPQLCQPSSHPYHFFSHQPRQLPKPFFGLRAQVCLICGLSSTWFSICSVP